MINHIEIGHVSILKICMFIFCFIGHDLKSQNIYWDTAYSVNEIEYHLIAGGNEDFTYAQIIRQGVDTVTIEGVNSGIDVVLYNPDEFPDILLTYMGNNPWNDLYIFNSEIDDYVFIRGIVQFPQSIRLGSDNVYYSYHRSGCADLNWDSDLFTIENDSAVHLANIYGIGCSNEDGRIEISRIAERDSAIIIETMKIDTIYSYEQYKWGFIEDYWSNNYRRFYPEKGKFNSD